MATVTKILASARRNDHTLNEFSEHWLEVQVSIVASFNEAETRLEIPFVPTVILAFNESAISAANMSDDTTRLDSVWVPTPLGGFNQTVKEFDEGNVKLKAKRWSRPFDLLSPSGTGRDTIEETYSFSVPFNLLLENLYQAPDRDQNWNYLSPAQKQEWEQREFVAALDVLFEQSPLLLDIDVLLSMDIRNGLSERTITVAS